MPGVSSHNDTSVHQPFLDGSSVAAERYKVKPSHRWRGYVRRAQRAGMDALYLLADAWFGSDAMINMACERLLIPICRMKKHDQGSADGMLCGKIYPAALEALKIQFGDLIQQNMETIERHMENFFVQARQLDVPRCDWKPY